MGIHNVGYDNSIDAFIPEFWAQESLALLEENMVAGNLVHRDFENTLAAFGDTVNTRKPATFTTKRKGVTDNVTVQDANATNIPVVLNQHAHVSFLIRDGEESKSMTSLVEEYLKPAMLAQSQFIDKVVLGQFAQFYTNSAGRLGNGAGNIVSNIVDTGKVLNIAKAPMEGRNLIWTPSMHAEALKTDHFTSAEKSGDAGTALRTASLGKLFNFDNYMCQNMTSLSGSYDTVTGAVNNAAGYPAGSTAITVDGFGAAIAVGTMLKIAGDDTPQRVVSITGATTAVVVTPGLKRAVVDNAVVTVYDPGAVNLSGGYAAGYDGYIAFDGMTNGVKTGSFVSFGLSSTAALYTVIDSTSTTILLDRPLEAAVANDAELNVCPPGDYNFAFHRNALALVVRPLALPRSGTGALSGIASYNGLSMRAVITYDGNKQGHLVTLDMLLGVKVLDTALGAVMLG